MVIALAMVVDLQLTTQAGPELPRGGCAAGVACSDPQRIEASEQYRQQVEEKEDALRLRFWGYALAVVGFATVLTLAGLRASPQGQRDVFADLGIAAIGWLCFDVILLLAATDFLVEVVIALVIAPVIVMIAAAAIGSALTPPVRTDIASEAPEPELPTSGGPGSDLAGQPTPRLLPAWLGLALSALAVALAQIQFEVTDPCSPDHGDWTNPLLVITELSAVGAALCGLVVLLGRRWISALICLLAASYAGFAGYMAAFACFT